MSLKSCNPKETNKYEIEVNVDADTFEKAVQKSYKKNIGKINVPGFRRGKAPRHMVEKLYGKDVFYNDAIEECYPVALEAAVSEAELKLVSTESIEEIDTENGFTFKAVIIVEPEVKIEGYKGIKVESKAVRVTEKMINEEIDKVRDRNSRMITVTDRAAENGDTAVIDYEGFVDGVAFDGGKAENHNLALGSGTFIPGFEDQIVGHNAEEEFSVFVTFPEEYHAENLAGKEAEFKIKLHEIKAKELPELDDEFVKDVSDKETVDEYKKEIKETLTKRLKDEREAQINNDLSDKLIELVQGEIPTQMYDNEVNAMLREFDMRLRSQGLDAMSYLKYSGMDVEGLANMYKPDAEKRVKLRLALEKIAKLENIEITEEDLDAEYAKMAEMYSMTVEQIKPMFTDDALKADLAVQKAMDIVRKEAVTK